MSSLADKLLPEIARQIHPDWRKNETEYWAVRDRLMGQYQGQWIGFADGIVIASGTSPVEVFRTAHQFGRYPYVTCVGREEEPTCMRRASFASIAEVWPGLARAVWFVYPCAAKPRRSARGQHGSAGAWRLTAHLPGELCQPRPHVAQDVISSVFVNRRSSTPAFYHSSFAASNTGPSRHTRR
jgi:hypothetical protein